MSFPRCGGEQSLGEMLGNHRQSASRGAAQMIARNWHDFQLRGNSGRTKA
jgi:hypothetical protein